jgi:hypothetical protein
MGSFTDVSASGYRNPGSNPGQALSGMTEKSDFHPIREIAEVIVLRPESCGLGHEKKVTRGVEQKGMSVKLRLTIVDGRMTILD